MSEAETEYCPVTGREVYPCRHGEPHVECPEHALNCMVGYNQPTLPELERIARANGLWTTVEGPPWHARTSEDPDRMPDLNAAAALFHRDMEDVGAALGGEEA